MGVTGTVWCDGEGLVTLCLDAHAVREDGGSESELPLARKWTVSGGSKSVENTCSRCEREPGKWKKFRS